ncbi:MAG: hypothetical protein AB1733_20630 [Thermodesulfobacteriota bacterium]
MKVKGIPYVTAGLRIRGGAERTVTEQWEKETAPRGRNKERHRLVKRLIGALTVVQSRTQRQGKDLLRGRRN